ncbi:MAG: CoA transferase, partial [Deltaproteobacteria bacterium]|nr:CoA transferase [Deltaproteobacteria bacterium]
YVGLGDNAEALTGHNWLRGYADDEHPILNTPVYHMDSSAGATAAFAAIMGLRRRRKTGQGTAIDFAQIESFIPQLGEVHLDYIANGRNQRTSGNRHPTAVQGCYRCRGEDRWINVTVNNDEEWQGLCQAMGHPAWSREERFSDQPGRRKHHDELDRLIEDWTGRHDNFELFHILQRNGVPAGPVVNEKDAFVDPHLNARGFFQVILQADTGTYRYPGFLWKMSQTPPTYRLPPCRLGEHNDYVFREVIGLSEEEISELEKEQIIGGDRYVWA